MNMGEEGGQDFLFDIYCPVSCQIISGLLNHRPFWLVPDHSWFIKDPD